MLIPDAFIKEKSLLKNVFVPEATRLGLSDSDAKILFESLPIDLKRTTAEKHILGFSEWRYVYGVNFNIGKGRGIGVPWQRPLVSNLINACFTAKKYLTKFQLNEWVKYLRNPAKHFGALCEMIVIKNVELDNKLSYEKNDSGADNKKIDWLLETPYNKILLEVKVRPGQVAIHLEQESQKAHSLLSEPIPDIEKLFIATASKFKPKVETTDLQGVALFLGVKVPRVPLENYFLKRLSDRLDFVALVKEDGSHVNLVAVSDEIKAQVLSGFKWIDDADFFLTEE